MAVHDLSLRARLVLLVALLFAAFALFFLVFFPARMDAQARRGMIDQALGLARLLATATEPALDFGDALNGQSHLERLSSTPEATFGLLLREDGTPLASWRPENARAIPPGFPQGARIIGQEVLARVDIHTRGGQRGALLLGFSLEKMHQEREHTLRLAATVSALIFGFGLLAAFGVGTVLVQPLKRVTQVALRVSEGELDAQRELDLTRRDETGTLAAALSRMLQRLREAHEQLITADRRTSVGTLAAGVAHEINNPLAYVTSNIQYTLRELPELRATLEQGCPPKLRARVEETWQEVADALTEAREGCLRVKHIVQSLKTFSRGEDDTHKAVRLQDTLEAAISMASNELRHRARLVRDYQPVPCVEANEVHLIQVFLNLLINAAHAIEPGAADQNEVRLATWRGEDGRVRVSISDTGSGMSPEVRSRLFTPFFTTKPVGEGTGLGLSVCQGIITRLGGHIEVHSEQGHGSTFTVVLPATTSSPSEPFPVAASSSPPVTRGGRVLVVDDDPFVRTALRRALGPLHDITLASSAREALGRILQGGAFDLILCDLMMPEMTGMEFFAELQRLYPSQAEAVVFFTGGAFTATTRDFIEQQAGRVLNKPVDTAHLMELLRARLERSPSPLRSLAAPMV
jgi:signal transduction histidine kinase/ActR/RegA family two-component response regulator